MRTEQKKRFSLLSGLMAGLFLLVVIGAHQNFSHKKLLTYEGDNIELSIDLDDEGDTDWGLQFQQALQPGEFIYIDQPQQVKTAQAYYTEQNGKKSSEKRLYILFHQLRSHIG
ncbi:MAG: hypothetical protein H6551_07545 [Chitinophagales bacterium]|nr:hypothetical protein [Chitinophagaceae bacterium]MCB9064983.1 hypothetical protein [Chitinophagales bacterium]